MSKGDFQESLRQAILVGIMLVGRLGVHPIRKYDSIAIVIAVAVAVVVIIIHIIVNSIATIIYIYIYIYMFIIIINISNLSIASRGAPHQSARGAQLPAGGGPT